MFSFSFVCVSRDANIGRPLITTLWECVWLKGGGRVALLVVCANALIHFIFNRDTLQVSWIIGVSIDVKD